MLSYLFRYVTAVWQIWNSKKWKLTNACKFCLILTEDCSFICLLEGYSFCVELSSKCISKMFIRSHFLLLTSVLYLDWYLEFIMSFYSFYFYLSIFGIDPALNHSAELWTYIQEYMLIKWRITSVRVLGILHMIFISTK